MAEVVWLLLRAARDLVAKYCGGSASAAERLIIEYAQAGYLKRYRGHGERLIVPRHWGFSDPHLGLYTPVDFDNSTVSYVNAGPVSETTKLMMEDAIEHLEKVVELPPPVFQMCLVHLDRDEVLSMLRKAELLELSEESPFVPAKNTQLPAAKEDVKARVKVPRLGKQEAVLDPIAKEIYGEDMPSLRPAEFQHAIENAIKAKSLKKTALPRDWVVRWDACRRYLKKRGKLRSD
jgi:hypothetical protein